MKNKKHKEPIMSDAKFYGIMAVITVIYLMFHVFTAVSNV